MGLMGKAALAMWWDMAAETRPDFEHWHSHEHFPERLGIPGFLRASRWRSTVGHEDGGEGFFVMYELADHTTLSSAAYLARLNAPTPWSTRLMPHHRHMVRSQCRVMASAGSAVSGHALTLRMATGGVTQAGMVEAFGPLCARLALLPGLAGAHLLRHEPPDIAPTTEQRIRGLGDQAADWVLLVTGYEAPAVAAVLQQPGLQAALGAAGATQMAPQAFRLCHSAVAGEPAALQ
ncbi:DUF4286 family protein [Aquincola tertiaricarbonis]|uniref:DUF4286 family protein n=1 Tax=Aquincola tertiaricarbonis TaxID=391953 RepID=UPI000614E068|nr:DUF4286 family protein [Aquincola tertiaricarbonis]